MPAPLVALLFWSAVAAAVLAQMMILGSTRRVLRTTVPRRLLLEWGFALVPAVALAVVLALSWRTTMRSAIIEVDLRSPPSESRS